MYVVDSQGVLHYIDNNGYYDILTVNQGALVILFASNSGLYIDGIEILIDPTTVDSYPFQNITDNVGNPYDFYLLKVVSSDAAIFV